MRAKNRGRVDVRKDSETLEKGRGRQQRRDGER